MYIYNKGGVKSVQCHKIALNIWEWAIAKDILWAVDRNGLISAEHCLSLESLLAGKVFHPYTQWDLPSNLFSKTIRNHWY